MDDAILAQIQGYVDAGAALLDEREPGWAKKIDTFKLDLHDCDACICGQALRQGFSTESLVALGIEPLESADYGFNASSDAFDALSETEPGDHETHTQIYYHTLDKFWLEKVYERT